MYTLDEKDQGLLAILRSNSRTPIVEISKRLSVSRTTVLNRINRLEKKGVIVGYSLLLGNETNVREIRAFMNIAAESLKEPQIVLSLRGNPNVADIFHTTGQWDLIVDIQTDSLSELNNLISSFRQLEGVKSTETNILLDRV